MKKIALQTLQGQLKKEISKEDPILPFGPLFSKVFQLRNGSYVKLYDPYFLQHIKQLSPYDIERKIIDAKPVSNVPEIIVPSHVVYNEKNGLFTGYIMPAAKGITLNQLDNRLSMKERTDLRQYADLYHLMEDFVKRANQAGFVFPDFCSLDNLYIYGKGNDRNLSMIDYDGMQIGVHPSMSFSTVLGNQNNYFIPKYWDDKKQLFNPNLDIKSLITEYFLMTFNINLAKVGEINPGTGKPVTLDDIFEQIQLDDDDFKHKVWKTFQPNGENEFLGDSVYRLAETHRLTYEKYRLSDIFPLPTELLDKDVVITQKRLIRK